MRDLTPVRRLALGALAFAGSTAYAASFLFITDAAQLVRIASAVGISAGCSWILFGAILLRSRGPGAWGWFDICLRTIAVGIGAKSAGMILNILVGALRLQSAVPVGLCHLLILPAADGAMFLIFARQSRSFGVPAGASAKLWLILNALFVAILTILLFTWRLS
jgi:hypothetical protein